MTVEAELILTCIIDNCQWSGRDLGFVAHFGTNLQLRLDAILGCHQSTDWPAEFAAWDSGSHTFEVTQSELINLDLIPRIHDNGYNISTTG